MENYAIEMLNITKNFSGNLANDNITLQVKKGEIHALLGENGAGKSTLMSILFGLYRADNGVIKKDGEIIDVKDPKDATRFKIGMVHQHFKLIENFSVIDNIILGAETTKYGFILKKESKEKVKALSEQYGLHVDLDAIVENITVGMQQRVEILKMLYRENDILIFDEPTAVLTPQEIEELLKIMKNLANSGKSIIFITHKINEILSVADRCSVLRKGKYIGTVNISETSKEELSEMMVGRKVNFVTEKKESSPTDVVLEVENLCVSSGRKGKNSVNDVSFKVRRGEIVCIAGIDGNGQSELVYSLTGLKKINSGNVLLNGVDLKRLSIDKRNKLGIAHIPEDRHKHGLVLDFSLGDNLVLKRFRENQFQKFGFIKKEEVKVYSDQLIEKFDVRSGEGAFSIVRSMSGGNQQKAIIARELDLNYELLIAVQPTRGLDVGAIEYIHKQIVEQRDAGKAVLLVSLELDEVMNLSDRILVMYEGEIVGEFNPKETTVNELGLYMAGSKKQTKEMK
ncbi:MAG: ABC transporter ATP-binding protein [Bacilli bacterium]|nr:ABC transporter ATP-binding protein [Bacilli bacterium]